MVNCPPPSFSYKIPAHAKLFRPVPLSLVFSLAADEDNPGLPTLGVQLPSTLNSQESSRPWEAVTEGISPTIPVVPSALPPSNLSRFRKSEIGLRDGKCQVRIGRRARSFFRPSFLRIRPLFKIEPIIPRFWIPSAPGSPKTTNLHVIGPARHKLLGLAHERTKPLRTTYLLPQH
jgi:hypothetical protein